MSSKPREPPKPLYRTLTPHHPYPAGPIHHALLFYTKTISRLFCVIKLLPGALGVPIATFLVYLIS